MIGQPKLGRKIAELRKSKGFTQEELVEKCNISVRTLQRIESGEVEPRVYTVKMIFKALDFNFDLSEEILTTRKLPRWLEQFYLYFIDLFNLKTNTMKKITILSIMLTALFFGIFAITNEIKAQKTDKEQNKTLENNSIETKTSSQMVFFDFECDGCMEEDGELIGRDIKFRNNGIFVDVRIIKLNKKTREFNVIFAKGTLYKNKVEVSIAQDRLNEGMIKYSADNIEKLENRIHLKGNAKLQSDRNESIETDEIEINLY